MKRSPLSRWRYVADIDECMKIGLPWCDVCDCGHVVEAPCRVPLVRGGQGRTDDEVERSAFGFLGAIALCVLCWGIVALLALAVRS